MEQKRLALIKEIEGSLAETEEKLTRYHLENNEIMVGLEEKAAEGYRLCIIALKEQAFDENDNPYFIDNKV